MPDESLEAKLQSLLDELNQDEATRQQADLQQRLIQRAAHYAEPQRTDTANDERTSYQVLTFSLGGERYSVDVRCITGVRSVESVTRIPSVPEFFRGVVNVRGKIITLLDLRHFFGIAVADDSLPREMLLVTASDLTLALLADHIEGVRTIPQRDIEPVEGRYARGVTGDQLVVLDVESLFADQRLFINGESS